MGTFRKMASEFVSVLEGSNYYPRLERISGYPKSGEARIGDRVLINFSSNNYLGLSNHPRVIEAAVGALKRFGLGSGGSRLTAGTQDPHVELEGKIAEFKRTEDAVVFSSGYLANTGTIPALVGATAKGVRALLKGTAGDQSTPEIFVDKLVHASILDGLAVASSHLLGTKLKISRFPHRSMKHLERLLQASEAEGKLIVTDGVFSLHGRIAPLGEIVRLARQYNAEVYVDDAHGTGIFGENGRGTAEMFGVEDQIDFPVSTLSKSLGGIGGFVAGDRDFCKYIRVAGRTHMFQTSLPPAVAAGLIVALDIVRDEPERRQTLLRRAAHLREELVRLGFNILNSETQIIPICFGDEGRAKRATDMLWTNGIFAPCYYYPAVGPAEAMVRVNITSGHSAEHLERLLTIVASAGRELGVIR